ncbi:ABC transporter ATP-binding protein [Rhodobacter calidifons]|uniref:ABC transporter ATP-binding protein n=1 Tax=Rhodobacter calidifons TaxID=2715277 RepID=A0ABX0GAY9_9RHOB|nr:ATP-binding cassette domain-containing protein [Rhodobacter calidifons]NHB78459.1 ABC transporter ATP-binding protein [Rhodobacter calidifons]
MTEALLSVAGLSVSYGGIPVLRDIAFDLAPGETLAILGLSGCGKSTLLRALLGLLPPSAHVEGTARTASGPVRLADRAALRQRLGREIGFVAQNPFDACAPLRRVRAHVEEAWRAHGLPPDAARIAGLCAQLGLDPATLDRHPHEWSGGMLQRANIAAAVALAPPVVLADEPTSAVDAETADAVMACLRAGAPGTVVVSHDLPLVQRIADRVLLIEDGRIAAVAARADLAADRLPPALRAFRQAGAVARPAAPGGEVVLAASGLAVARGGLRLIEGLDLALCRGEVIGIAGRSGTGKSTLLAVLAGALPPAAGVIRRSGALRPPQRGEVLSLFQDSLSSMNRRWPLSRIVAEPLTVAPRRVPGRARRDAAVGALAAFGLGHLDPGLRPEHLSFGQAQRVTLARASLAGPALVLADEPTSALDPRQKARALDGLARLAEAGAGIVLVSHDRALLDTFCHRTLLVGWSGQGPAPERSAPAAPCRPRA